MKMEGQSTSIQADLGNIRQIETLFDSATEKFGTDDILVNNAGTILYKKVEGVTEEQISHLASRLTDSPVAELFV